MDKILIAGSTKENIDILKFEFNYKFEMKELREAKGILGMEIIRDT